MTMFEEFADNNDNLALRKIGIINKLRSFIGFGDSEEEPDICFRIRWTAVEPSSGSVDLEEALGRGACVPILKIQYAFGGSNGYQHQGGVSALYEKLALDNDEILQVEQLASRYDTEISNLD